MTRSAPTRASRAAPLAALLGASVLLAACNPDGVRMTSSGATQRDSTQVLLESSRRTAIVTAVEAVSPAVVSINVTARQRVAARSAFDWMFVPRSTERLVRSFGTGLVVLPRGVIVTNQHVVANAEHIAVTLGDGRSLPATVLGEDPLTDIAVLRVEADQLPVARIGQSDDLLIGEWVVALGNPYAFLLGNAEPTVTVGVVSATGRNILPSDNQLGLYLDMIQTDAAINPGNSGGPLFNLGGEVVGINSQIYSRTGGFMGISFAIPIDEAMRVADQLRESGRVIRGRIGVGIADVTRDVAEPLGLPRTAGALVRSVEADGPADKAGVQVGDIILRFGDRQIDKASDLPRLVGGTKPGTKVDMQVWRRGDQRTLALTVDELKPEASAGAGAPGAQPGQPAPVQANALGLAVTDIPADRLEQLRLKNGVLVESAEGAAEAAGLRPGDIVIAVNNTDVSSAKQFNELVKALDRAKPVVLLVRRGDTAQFVPIRPEQR